MNLDRPGKLHDDGVFVFDEPVKVRCLGIEVFAEGYINCGTCATCVFISPWPSSFDKNAYAIKHYALDDGGGRCNTDTE